MSGQRSDPPMSAGHVDWFLAITRLNAVRRRVEREGFTRHVGDALAQTLADLTRAAVTIDAERTAAVVDIRSAADL